MSSIVSVHRVDPRRIEDSLFSTELLGSTPSLVCKKHSFRSRDLCANSKCYVLKAPRHQVADDLMVRNEIELCTLSI